MTYDEKKAWLGRYRQAEKLLRQLESRLEEAHTAARRTTRGLCAAPGGSSDGQALPRAVEREDELERQVAGQLAECETLYADIHEALQGLDDIRCCRVLKGYYLDLLTWNRVAAELHYSLRMVYVLRRKALDRLEL